MGSRRGFVPLVEIETRHRQEDNRADDLVLRQGDPADLVEDPEVRAEELDDEGEEGKQRDPEESDLALEALSVLPHPDNDEDEQGRGRKPCLCRIERNALGRQGGIVREGDGQGEVRVALLAVAAPRQDAPDPGKGDEQGHRGSEQVGDLPEIQLSPVDIQDTGGNGENGPSV